MSSGNNHVVLIMGKPNSGKSTSLRTLTNQDRYVYLNTDLKAIPFKHEFNAVNVSDPLDILGFIEEIESNADIDGVVLDTLTFLMDQFEQQYVVTSSNTQKMWGEFASFYKKLIHTIKKGSKDYAILAHAKDVMNESEMILETKVPIKGSVGATGAEADFTTILGAKAIPIKEAMKWENDLLTISDEEKEDGIKFVFQTRIDKDSVGHKYRSQMGLWKRNEKYINNDLQAVFNRLHDYYS
jgi:hypothetical protein